MSEFKALLARKNQRFVCRSTAWPRDESKSFVAHIEHRVEGPMPASVRKTLLHRLRDVPDLAAFYDEYGSAKLYCDTLGPDSAFYIGGPDAWRALRSDFVSWFENLTEEEEERYLPEWLKVCVVIGEIPRSGNFLLVPMSGDLKGEVYEFEHDGFEFIKRGNTFDDFLSYASTVDDKLINDIACYTRYSDGETETQWLAEKYQFDE